MENNEEYLLRALRRTSSGLTDSLIPAHGAKLTKLLQKIETSESVSWEVQSLLNVQGFGKCALAMEWLLERTQRSNDFFSPEQFESDVLLLNEKLFEAFLNQPFDMPDFSRTFEAPVRPIQQDIQVSDDEFFGSSHHVQQEDLQASVQPPEPEGSTQTFAEPSWDTSQASIDSFEAALIAAPTEPQQSSSQQDTTPALSEAMTPDLFESAERVAQTAIEFFDKTPGERPVAMAVFRVTARAAGESAKSAGNVIVQEFFDSILKLIAYADEQGKIKSDPFADIIRDIGDRLSGALKEQQGGITHLKNLTMYVSNPKELFSKR
ncbi:MAG: hypothetical protein WCW35_01000 [Bacteroidota bacterium]